MSNLNLSKMAETFEFIEAEAYANLLLCAPPEFSRPFRLEVRHIGSICVTMIPGLGFLTFNNIIGMGIGEPATESLLDEAIATFQNADCKNYKAQVGPVAQPTQIPDWFSVRGFTPGRKWAKLYRGNEPAPAISTDLRLEKIGEEQANAFANVVLPAYHLSPICRSLVKGNIGKPGWHHYLAFDGKEPVSAAAMFTNGEVAWLGWQCTLMAFRKRGGQSALIARRIADGLTLGCKWFVAETKEDTPDEPNPSCHNLVRNGFKQAYLRRNYIHQSPVSRAEVLHRKLFNATYILKVESHSILHKRKKG